jgi:ubiquinone/menaquinone biosynthesis C-methylase UbiE
MKADSFGALEDADCGLCGSARSEVLVVQHRFGEDFHVVQCASCGLIRTNPRPTAEWKARFYDPEYNALPEQHGRDFVYAAEDNRLPPYRRLLRFVKSRMKPGQRLIDVGAASGAFAKMAVDEGIEAVACDYSREAVDFCRERFKIETIHSPAEAIAVPDESFDFVTMLHTIEHLPDPLRVMREMLRILKPGGTFFLETPNYALHLLVETRLKALFPLYRYLTKREGLPWVPFDHYYHWTPRLMRRALTEVGFREARSHHILGYRSETKPNAIFWCAYASYDLLAAVAHALSGGRWDLRLVQLATARK